MRKILFVATVVRDHILKFHVPFLRMCSEMGLETAVAAADDMPEGEPCVIPYCDVYYNIPFSRDPFDAGNVRAFRMLKKVIDEGGFDVIHCHTPVAAALCRIAASNARKRGTKVIYTAHGFQFYRGGPVRDWILYYPVERMLAHQTDVLVTINREDYETAAHFGAKEVRLIPGTGIDTEYYADVRNAGKPDARAALGIPDRARVVLSVGDLNRNKNHRLMIRVLPGFKNVWYVLCGEGLERSALIRLAEELGVRDRVVLTGFLRDVRPVLATADVFALTSFREGLPVSLMEAMSAGLKCISSRNRGSRELLPEGPMLFDAEDPDSLAGALRYALTHDCKEEIAQNKETVKSFDIARILEEYKEIYSR